MASPMSILLAPVLRRAITESASAVSLMNATSTSTESIEVVTSRSLAMVYWLSMNEIIATESFAIEGTAFFRAGARDASVAETRFT